MNYEATKENLKFPWWKSNSAKSLEFLCNIECCAVRHILLGERTFICAKKSHLLGFKALGKGRQIGKSSVKVQQVNSCHIWEEGWRESNLETRNTLWMVSNRLTYLVLLHTDVEGRSQTSNMNEWIFDYFCSHLKILEASR